MRNTIKLRNDEDYYIVVTSYQDNGRLALFLYDENKEPYSDITINLPDMPITDIDEGFINGDFQSVAKDMVDELKTKGIIKDSFGFIPYNYGNYEYVKFDLEKLKEFDSIGISEIVNSINKDINIGI